METTRNPVALVTALVTALGGLLTTLVTWALTAIPEEVPDEVTTALGLLLYAVVAWVGWLIGRWAQAFTTPASDPRDDDGVPLVSELKVKAAEAHALEVERAVQDGPLEDTSTHDPLL